MPYSCPKCDGNTGVIETLLSVRQRKCLTCGHKFHTIEEEWKPPQGYSIKGARTADYRDRKKGRKDGIQMS